MMSIEEAERIFKKKYPDLVITKTVDYDSAHYVICAVKDYDNRYSELDPFYAVDKKSKQITYFSPAGDLEHFGKLMSE